MHTGETLAAAPPARPLRQSRLGGLSLFLALAGVAIALAVMALALGERIDLSDENHLLGLFAALLAVFAVSTCGLVLGLAGLLRRSRKRHLALAGIVLNLSCLLWGWHALSTAAAASNCIACSTAPRKATGNNTVPTEASRVIHDVCG